MCVCYSLYSYIFIPYYIANILSINHMTILYLCRALNSLKSSCVEVKIYVAKNKFLPWPQQIFEDKD